MTTSGPRAYIYTASVRPDVRYVAEHHENLQHVLLFFIVSDGASGSELKVEVVPTMPNDGNGSSFVVTSGAKTSSPLILPVPVVSGTRNVRVQGEHYEVRLMTDHGPSTPTEPGVSLLMDATQLSDSKPTNFACASCSLPLLHSSTNQRYRDLPSEHWEELVDAWMCHADQKLHEHVMKSARGFLPEKDQALVGGSYILFEESAVVKTNLRSVEQANVSAPVLVRSSLRPQRRSALAFTSGCRFPLNLFVKGCTKPL